MGRVNDRVSRDHQFGLHNGLLHVECALCHPSPGRPAGPPSDAGPAGELERLKYAAIFRAGFIVGRNSDWHDPDRLLALLDTLWTEGYVAGMGQLVMADLEELDRD
jgi:hypothetical protein